MLGVPFKPSHTVDLFYLYDQKRIKALHEGNEAAYTEASEIENYLNVAINQAFNFNRRKDDHARRSPTED